MRILVWGIEKDLDMAKTKANYLLNTANHFNVDLEFLGIGKTFSGFRQRLYILQEHLKTLGENEIVIVMDGYDTLFNNNPQIALQSFLDKNTRILISAEKMFTYQYSQFFDNYEKIESPYKYVNAGTYMGYAGDIAKMIEELFEIPYDAIDQGLIGIWAYDKLDDPYKVQLDINCDIFWVTSGDWYEIEKIAQEKTEIINPNTNTKPFVVHNTGNSDFIIGEIYKTVYKNIIGNTL